MKVTPYISKLPGRITKLPAKISKLPSTLNVIPNKYRSVIREKAINRARTRIVVAGGNPADFNQADLEVVVKEEEDKIKSSIREKGLLAVLALLGLNFFG